jgi:HD-GYP domain-containing protein (c-di-GMP phosphodiesterase class II)
MTIAGRLQLSEEQRSALFYALLLKDAGCSSNTWKVTALFGADDFDALSQDRPYRPAMTMEKVLTILQERERPEALSRVRRSPGDLVSKGEL